MPKTDTSSKVNNSTLTPAVFDVQQQIHYKYLYRTHLFRVGFSEHPETYLVNISGTTLDDHKVEVSRVYDELHPLMAIGRAVTEFYDNYVCGRIGSIIIKQRVVNSAMAHVITLAVVIAPIAAVFNWVLSRPRRMRITRYLLNEIFEQR